MIINELFNRTSDLKEFNANKSWQDRAYIEKFGINAEYMFLTHIEGHEYAFYFAQDTNNEYAFGYGLVAPYMFGKAGDKHIEHSISNKGVPFKVMPVVIQVLEYFIRKYEPEMIHFTGYEERQDQLYDRLMKYFGKKLPKPYVAGMSAGHFTISRDEEGFGVNEEQLTELFNGSDQVEELDPRQAIIDYRLPYTTKFAYLLPLKGDEYVFYFNKSQQYEFDNFYEYSYGKVGINRKVSYTPTNNGIPFKIIPAVIQVLFEFIRTHNPLSIAFHGAVNKQDQFYSKVAKFLKAKLPKPYVIGMEGDLFIITKDEDFIPELKLLENLIEDAQSDIDAVGTAKAIADKFIKWLARANRSIPLKNLMTKCNISDDIKGLAAPAEQFGCPEYNDLKIGFAWGAVELEALLTMPTIDGKKEAWIFITVPNDPSAETGIYTEINKEYLVHELTHYLDFKKQKVIKPADVSSAKNYFNSPSEFNAYFIEGLHKILHNDVPVHSFQDFYKQHIQKFGSDFIKHLNPVYRKKFLTRLYKVFEYLRDNDNPNAKDAELASR